MVTSRSTQRFIAVVVTVLLVCVACGPSRITTTHGVVPSTTAALTDAITGISGLAPGSTEHAVAARTQIRSVDAGYTVEPYEGIGTWLDVFDWSVSYTTSGVAAVEPDAVDRMAAMGAQTLFIQTARYDNPADVLEPERLNAFIARAHANDMKVVGWYLPTYENPAVDYRRIMAIADLAVDGLTVNIESVRLEDVPTRNRRAVDLARLVRDSLPGSIIGTVVLPPIVTEFVAPGFWPAFPWQDLVSSHDVWMTMAYWTNRTEESGWRDGYTYTNQNLALLRRLMGDEDLVVHPVGGLSGSILPGQVAGMVQAATENDAIGTSVYDYPSMSDGQWAELATFGSSR